MARHRGITSPATSGSPEPAHSPEQLQETLADLVSQLRTSPVCSVCEDHPALVLGEGSPRARIMFVAAAPSPFPGAAGELLIRMIEAMGLKQEDVYLANLRKCSSSPSSSQNPNQTAILSGVSTCADLLDRQIAAIRPEAIVALGEFAAESLVGEKLEMTCVRGHFKNYRKLDIPVMPTFHPGYLLEHAASKREAWEDLKAVAKHLGIEIPMKGPRKPSGVEPA